MLEPWPPSRPCDLTTFKANSPSKAKRATVGRTFDGALEITSKADENIGVKKSTFSLEST